MDGASGDLFVYLLRDIGGASVADHDDAAGDRKRVRRPRRTSECARSSSSRSSATTSSRWSRPRRRTRRLLPHDVSLVADRSGGNPQFALDLVQVVASGAMLPESIETAAMARIDALAPADRALVRRASVLGMAFHRRFLVGSARHEAPPCPTTKRGSASASSSSDDGDGLPAVPSRGRPRRRLRGAAVPDATSPARPSGRSSVRGRVRPGGDRRSAVAALLPRRGTTKRPGSTRGMAAERAAAQFAPAGGRAALQTRDRRGEASPRAGGGRSCLGVRGPRRGLVPSQ